MSNVEITSAFFRCCFPTLSLTSERRLHGRLDEPGEQLLRLGVLRQAGRERAQGVGVPGQALQGHALAVVGLERGARGQG